MNTSTLIETLENLSCPMLLDGPSWGVSVWITTLGGNRYFITRPAGAYILAKDGDAMWWESFETLSEMCEYLETYIHRM